MPKPPVGSATPRPTHAGGVVHRRGRTGAIEVLVVTAKRRRDEWVLPKGHVERGESPEDTAAREVAEEAGVVADVVAPLRDTTRTVNGEAQVVRYYAMAARGKRTPDEDRQVAWLDPREAMTRLTFKDARDVLQDALNRLDQEEDR